MTDVIIDYCTRYKPTQSKKILIYIARDDCTRENGIIDKGLLKRILFVVIY